MSEPERRKSPWVLLGIAAVYVLSARLGLSLATLPAQVTAIWPPAGVAVTALLVFGTRAWPAVAAGAFIANVFANEPVFTAALIAAGNTLEAVAAVLLIRRRPGFSLSLNRVGDIIWLAPVSLISGAIAATIGVTSLWLGGIVPASSASGVWLLWWLGDAAGIFIFAPLLLTWHSPQRAQAQPMAPARIALFFAVLAAVSVLVFSGVYAHSAQVKFFLFPVIVWSAYWLEQRYTATAVVLISIIAIFGQVHGSHAFMGDSLNERFLIIQGYIAVMGLTGLCLGAVVAERRRLQAELQSAHDHLEDRVKEKTRELSASEKTLQDFIDNLSTFTAKVDTKGNILLAGRAAQLASGLPLEELLKTNFFDGDWFKFDPAVHARVRQAFERAVRGEAVNYDERVRVFNTTDVTINFSLVPVMGRDGVPEYILAEGRDITAQKQAEQNLRSAEAELKASYALLEQRVEQRTAELRQSEQRLQAIIDNSNTIVVMKDPSGKFLLVNREWEKANNLKRDWIIGRTMYDYFPKPVADKLTENDREVLAAGTAFQFEEKVPHPGSAPRIYISNKFPLLDEHGATYAICSISTDITARKQAEKRIVLQYAVTKILAESPDFADASSKTLEEICRGMEWDAAAIWVIPPEKDHLECVHIFNEKDVPHYAAATRSKEITRGVGLPGLVWETRQPQWVTDIRESSKFPRAIPASQDGLVSGLGFPIQVGNEIYGMMEFLSKSAAQPDAEIIGMMGGIGIQLGHFIQRKTAELAIRESEARQRAILESAMDCVITIDHHGAVIEWNPAAETTFGYSRAEVLGREMAELIIPLQYRESHRKGMAHFVATGQSRILNKRLELSAVRKDGTEFPCELAITRVPGSQPAIFTGYLRDITERKSVELREKQAKEQAERANRAKDEFLAVVSHELRTPLTPILGWTRILRSGRLDPAQIAHALETIERNVKAQGKLIEDLLDISRVITGKLKVERRPMVLADVLPHALETVQPAADAKHIQIQMSYRPGVGTMLGDSERLQQVVWNLLSNAIKFSPDGGRVEVSIHESNEYVEVWVQDNGPGIDPKFLPHIFNRFSQEDSSTTRKHGGLGLGLAIVRHITELHGGSVSAENRKDARGALFKVRLPRGETQAPGFGDFAVNYTAQPVPQDSGLTLKDMKILVIDNDDDVRHLVATTLKQWGAEVLTAESAVEGIAAIKQSRPGLVLCDIGMPVDDGYAFLKMLRELPPGSGRDVPVIALTAYTRADDRARILAAGFQLHIPKPVDPFELIRVLSKFSQVG